MFSLHLKRNALNFLISLGTLVFCSLLLLPASPLSKGNIWVDTNAMLEIGRGWSVGRIPYLDMFEQRGPILFFYNLIANLIDSKGYFGLFWIEITNFIAMFLITTQIFKKIFLKSITPFLSVLLPIFIMLSQSFETGGSPEEFAITWSLLGVLLAINASQLTSKRLWLQGFLFGITVGIVFWIKFTLLGALIGSALFILLYLLHEKQFNKLLTFIMSAVSSFLTILLLISAYFFANHAFKSLIDVYFKMNITAYGGKSSIFERLIAFKHVSFDTIISNSWIFSLALTSILILWVWQKKLAVLLILVSVTTFGITYGVGQARLYSFLHLYAVLVLIVIIGSITLTIQYKYSYVLLVYLFLFFPIIQNPFFAKMPYFWKKETIAPQSFGTVITKDTGTRDKSLIYYNIIDAGVERYTNVQVAKRFKYFERTNVPDKLYPQQQKYLEHVIKNSESTYVVVGLNWGGQQSINLKDDKIVESHIPQEVLRNYKLIARDYSYYPVETDKNQFQLALLKRR